MDPWRIALLVAVGLFVAFLLIKMRPQLDEEAPADDLLEPLATRAERAVWKRLVKLPAEGRARIAARLEVLLEGEEDVAELASEPGESGPGTG